MTDEARRRRRLVVCGSVFAVFVTASSIGVAFMPWLLANQPLWLVGISPLFRHMVLVAPSVPASSLFAVAVPRHFAPDPFVYVLGRDYGPAAIAWIDRNSPGVGRVVRALERAFTRVGPIALLFSPDVVVSTLAGAARVPFPVFAVMNLLGTVGMVIVARWFGHALESQIQAFVAFLREHVVSATVVSVLLAVAWSAWTQRKRPGDGDPARVE